MKNVQRFEITDTIKEPPTYGGRLDENGNSINPNSVYGREWDEIAHKYLQEHKYCERCLKEGKHVRAALVHHVQYVRNGGGNGNGNLQALCHHCHEEIHKRRKVDHMDNVDVKQAHEDMATPEQALATLKAAEAGYYMNDDRRQGNAARTDERPLDDTATPEQALEALKATEADSYLQEV